MPDHRCQHSPRGSLPLPCQPLLEKSVSPGFSILISYKEWLETQSSVPGQENVSCDLATMKTEKQEHCVCDGGVQLKINRGVHTQRTQELTLRL